MTTRSFTSWRKLDISCRSLVVSRWSSVVRDSSLLEIGGARPVSVRDRRRGKPRLYGKSNALAPQIGAPSQMHQRPTTDDQRLPSIRQRRSLRGPAFGGKI